MNFKWIPLAALLAIPGLAQEGPWQVGLGLNTTGKVKLQTEGTFNSHRALELRKEPTTALALQLGYRFYNFGTSDLSVTAEYQPQVKADMELTVFGNNRGTVGNFKSGFVAPGIQWNIHRAVDFGFGLQYRFERLSGTIQSNSVLSETSISTSYARPWLNAYIGYTFKVDSTVKPYVALRLAKALTSTNEVNLTTLGTNAGNAKLLRSLAGDQEVSLQAGIRF